MMYAHTHTHTYKNSIFYLVQFFDNSYEVGKLITLSLSLAQETVSHGVRFFVRLPLQFEIPLILGMVIAIAMH